MPVPVITVSPSGGVEIQGAPRQHALYPENHEIVTRPGSSDIMIRIPAEAVDDNLVEGLRTQLGLNNEENSSEINAVDVGQSETSRSGNMSDNASQTDSTISVTRNDNVQPSPDGMQIIRWTDGTMAGWGPQRDAHRAKWQMGQIAAAEMQAAQNLMRSAQQQASYNQAVQVANFQTIQAAQVQAAQVQNAQWQQAQVQANQVQAQAAWTQGAQWQQAQCQSAHMHNAMMHAAQPRQTVTYNFMSRPQYCTQYRYYTQNNLTQNITDGNVLNQVLCVRRLNNGGGQA